MRNWKLTVFYFGIILVLAALPACGGTQELTPTPGMSIRIITPTPRNTATPTVTPTPVVPELDRDALEGIQIDFWYIWNPTVPDMLDELVREFNRQNEPGITVTVRSFTHPADFASAMQEAIAARQAPHVVLAHPYEYNAWGAVGALVELSPYLESPSYGLTEAQLAQIFPVFLDRDLYGSQRWGFPGLFSARVMLYNQTWARQLGFESPPASAAAFTRQACAANIENGGLTGGWMIDTSPGSAAAWLLAYSGGLESGSRYAFDSEGVEAALTFLSDLYIQGCAWQPAVPFPDQDFVDRLGLFYPVSTREIAFVEQAFEQSSSRDRWTAVAYPNDLGESTISVYGTSYVLLESSIEEQIAAWLFVREMTSQPNQVRLAEAGLYLPLNRDVSAELQADGQLPTAWLDALDLLDQAVYEPRFTSWAVVRAVVQDAVTEVMDERFAPGTMSLFLKQLQDLVADLHP